MSSDEEYLDELLKSMAEDEGKSGNTDSAMDDLANGNPEGADWGGDGEGIPDVGNMTEFAIDDTGMREGSSGDFGAVEELLGDFSVQDFGEEERLSKDFAVGDFDKEQGASGGFAGEDIGMPDRPSGDYSDEYFGTEQELPGNFAIEDYGTQEEALDDFGMGDSGTEEEEPDDLAPEDFGMEEEPSGGFGIEGPGTEEELPADFSIEDFGTGEEPSLDFGMEDLGTGEEPLLDFGMEDLGTGEEPSLDFGMEDFGTEEEPLLDSSMEDSGTEESSLPDFAIEDFGMEEEPPADYGIQNSAMEETAESVQPEEENEDHFAIEDFGVIEPEEGELAALEEAHLSENDTGAFDVDAMFAEADAETQGESLQNESSQIEINSEEDMLALLESMSNEIEAEQAAAEQAAALAKSEAMPEGAEEEDGKKKKRKLFGRKKDDGGKTDNIEGDGDEISEEPAKPPGFFSKLISFLTESDEEEEDALKEGMEPSDENKSILEELDKEDKNKKKKKEKGKKGKEDESEEADPKKEKKEKKEKKKKEKKEKKDAAAADALETVPERPSKRVSKKSVAVIAGLGLTLMAMVIVLCGIVPSFFDKKDARAAYYNADYKKSFELLYGKKLNDSDTIIYNQSLTIMEMNRKLEAYHNYLALGEDVRALDALMIGVQNYPDILLKAEEFHVTHEVDAVYETILNILNDKYGISENDAEVIIAYDDVTYTRKLESVVKGTPFVDPNAEVQVSADVLSEEQDFYESTPNNVLGADDNNERNPGEEQADVPGNTQENTLGTEDEAREHAPAAESIEADNVLGTDMDSEDNYIPEESLPEQNSSESPAQETTPAANENAGSSSGSQGKMIQGIRQPIDVQIHGN